MKRISLPALLMYVGMLLLLLPGIWYSLHTPFALIDDYGSWHILRPGYRADYAARLFSAEPMRFRPVFELYNLLTWAVFRENSMLHHLLRLALKFSAAVLAARTLQVWYPVRGRGWNLPVFFFLALFLFVPNNPEARLAPQETILVLALSAFLYLYSMLLARDTSAPSPRRCQIFALLGVYIALVGSKESALGMALLILPLLWLTVFRRGAYRLWLLPFIVSFAFALYKSVLEYRAQTYGVAGATQNLLFENARVFASWLLFTRASPLLSLFLALFLGAGALLVLAWLGGGWRVKFLGLHSLRSRRMLLLAFVGLSLAGTFLFLLLSAGPVLRYLFPVVFLMSFFVAMTSGEIALHAQGRLARWLPAFVLLGAAYFVIVNYYNFNMQYAVQYHTRVNEARMMEGVRSLLAQGEQVYVDGESEYETNIRQYFQSYLPYFRGEVLEGISNTEPRPGVGERYYRVTRVPVPDENVRPYATYATPTRDRFLDIARAISSLAIGGRSPYTVSDAGARSLGRLNWFVYEVHGPGPAFP